VLVAVTAVFSVGVFAIPASMLAWGFEAEAERMLRERRARRKLRRRLRRLHLKEAQVQSSSSDSSWVEEEEEGDDNRELEHIEVDDTGDAREE